MSTNGMESWAVDLKDVGAIYPFQGTEVILVILGVAFWIAFLRTSDRKRDTWLFGDPAPISAVCRYLCDVV